MLILHCLFENKANRLASNNRKQQSPELSPMEWTAVSWSSVVCFLLDNFPASEFYMPTFWNTLFHLHRQIGAPTCLWRWNRQCSEASAYKIQTPENYPEESTQRSEHDESLKSLRSHWIPQTNFCTCTCTSQLLQTYFPNQSNLDYKKYLTLCLLNHIHMFIKLSVDYDT